MRKWTVPVIMSGGGGQPAEAQPDAAFSFLPFSIYDDGDGTFSIGSWDISTQVSRAGGTYYVTKAGNDTTGDGLTEGTAWKTLTKAWTALAAVSNACVKVGVGRYGWSDGGFNDTLTSISGRSLVALGDGDVVIDAYFVGTGSWTLSGGYSATYEKPYAVSIDCVLDFGTLDGNGYPATYSVQTSVSNVEANAGSFYQTGGVLYVHCLDGTSPDADIRPQYVGQRAPRIAVNDITTYWEGLRFFHTQPQWVANGAGNTGVAYLKNCRFAFLASTTKIAVTGYTAYLHTCQYTQTGIDALTGNAGSTNVAKIVEIDCTGWSSGTVGSTGINASTNHSGGINVVINGEYYNTYGPPVGFIGDGKAWILGASIHDDLSAWDITLLLQESAWLDRVVIAGNTTDISANTTIYVRDCTPASPSVTGGGSVAAY